MAKYSAIKALVNAYIKRNGKKEITGSILNSVLSATIDSLGKYFQFAGYAMPTDNPGTPDQNVCYLAGEPGIYTDFGNIIILNEEVALLFWDGTWQKKSVLIGIREVSASVDNNTGIPSVDVSYSQGNLVLTFHNLKGEKGNTGDAAGFGTIGADVDGNIGTPGVSVETSGDDTAKNLMFHFTNLKGETGVTSVVATIDNTSGTPSCQVSLVGQQLTLAFSGLKGIKGDTGVSADYPITIYNGLDSDATDAALSAAQGKVLDGKVTELEAKLTGYNGLHDGSYVAANNTLVAATGKSYTDYIPVTAGVSYLYDYGAIDMTLNFVFVDDNDTFVDYYSQVANNTYRNLTTPAGATKVRFSCTTGYLPKVYLGDTLVWTAKVDGINGRVENLENALASGGVTYNSLDASLKNKIDSIDGKISKDEILEETNPNLCDFSNEDITEVSEGLSVNLTSDSIALTKSQNVNMGLSISIPLENGRHYNITALCVGGDADALRLHYYDEDSIGRLVAFNYLDNTYSLDVNVGNWTGIELLVSIKYNVSELIVSNVQIRLADIPIYSIDPEMVREIADENLSESFRDFNLIEQIPTSFKGDDVVLFRKGVCIGDSLTAGVFNRNNPSVGYETIPSFSYPAKLEQLTGIELTNLGVGGVTTEGWYDLYKNEDLSGFDFAIIQLGVNDHEQGQSVWPVADKDAMRSIITKLLSENNGIAVFVSTIIPATSFGGRSYISQGIRDLIEEINNPMVILLDMEEYGHTGESSAYNCGHLSAYGYTRLAMDYKAYISYVISTNKTLFRQVQFVGTNMSY